MHDVLVAVQENVRRGALIAGQGASDGIENSHDHAVGLCAVETNLPPSDSSTNLSKSDSLEAAYECRRVALLVKPDQEGCMLLPRMRTPGMNAHVDRLLWLENCTDLFANLRPKTPE
jgi:hypothetical protein